MTAEPSDPDWEPGTPGVGVTFFGPYFALTVLWTLDKGDTDAQTIAAAAIWFRARFGFDPRTQATKTTVAPVPT